jgi:hypothetical protein
MLWIPLFDPGADAVPILWKTRFAKEIFSSGSST